MRRFPHATLPRLTATFALLFLSATLARPEAQVAGRNVNMVTGGTFPGGDPFRAKQNETSLAISTRNPCHLLGGANDYRAVFLPGLPDDKEIGDAWLGWYESTDCGNTWYSTLVPGFPQDTSPEGKASPVYGLSAGADPVIRSGAAGTFYYLFIAFNRGSNVGKLALARAIDHNDFEAHIDPDKITDVAARRARSPIKYVDTIEIARGSSGQFIDKPTVSVFPAATGTCVMDGETVPATNVYFAWTEFVGNSPENQRSKVYFARSADCGRTLAGPATKLSEGYPLGQGTAIAVNPKNPNDIYVVWRQIRNDRNTDAILYARSLDGGRSFTRAEPVPGLGETQFAPFDQRTTSTALSNATTTFRTTAYPSLAFADDGFLYLAVSQVPSYAGGLGGVDARITLLRTDGVTWTAPVPVVLPPAGSGGQQFMPALAYAAGKLQLVWYDVRYDESEQTQTALIDEAQALREARIRRTIDLLGAQASLPASGWPPVFQMYGVSQPDYNDNQLVGPRISQYLIGDPDPGADNGGPRQLRFNRANLLLYGGGSIPFMGDYIDVAGIPFVLDGTGKWVINGLVNVLDPSKPPDPAMQVFQAAWTDNRDAHVGNASYESDGRLKYAPPSTLPSNATINDVQCPAGVDNTGTRDANVYTSRITQDFSLTVPGNAKPKSPGVVRAFAIQLANNLELTPGTTTPETPTLFRLTLADPSPPSASFSRYTFASSLSSPECALRPGQSAVTQIFVNVLPRSSVARTIYVRCGAATANRIVVTATRMIDASTPSTSSASVVLNPEPGSRGTKKGDGSPLGPETHTPDAENPDAENPDAENPDAENPDAENPDAENPDAENPDAENPDAENPDAENPDAENPDAENPDAENGSIQDVSADVTNDGDTTSAFQVQAQTSSQPSGDYSFVLIGRRVYSTPTSINCHLVRERRNQILFSIPLTAAELTAGTFFDENDASVKHPTFLAREGESIRVTLRVVAKGPTTPAFCSADPTSPDYCFNKIVIRTQAQAPDTGQVEPSEDFVGTLPGPDLTIDGAISPSATVAGIGGFVDVEGVTIRNAGNQDASDFSWASSITSPGTGRIFSGLFGVTGSLTPGGEIPTGPFRVYIPFSYGIEGSFPLPPGPYSVALTADSGGQVAETNEGNNVADSAAPITVADYRVAFAVPSFLEGNAEPVSVTVTGPGGALISGANVALALEGPDAEHGVPGPPGVMTPTTPSALTSVDGVAGFSIAIADAGNNYRLVATVTIVGVGVLRFQSDPFQVDSP